jgi:hypothetical protein
MHRADTLAFQERLGGIIEAGCPTGSAPLTILKIDGMAPYSKPFLPAFMEFGL